MSYVLSGLRPASITQFLLMGLTPGAAAPEDDGGSMSSVRVAQLRAYLRITHRLDDAVLQDAINGAEEEALAYMDREVLPRRGEFAVDECDSNTPPPVSDSNDLSPLARIGIYKVAQGLYEGKDAAEMEAIRESARRDWFPFRNRLGV
jgi:hypothetical protein